MQIAFHCHKYQYIEFCGKNRLSLIWRWVCFFYLNNLHGAFRFIFIGFFMVFILFSFKWTIKRRPVWYDRSQRQFSPQMQVYVYVGTVKHGKLIYLADWKAFHWNVENLLKRKIRPSVKGSWVVHIWMQVHFNSHRLALWVIENRKKHIIRNTEGWKNNKQKCSNEWTFV